MSGKNDDIVGFNSRWSSFGAGIVGWGAAALFFFPIFWMVHTSFKTEEDAQSLDPVFFFTPSLDRYREVTEDLAGSLSALQAFTNSIVVVLISTLLVLLLGIPAAYSLAVRPVEKWRDVLFFFISTKFLPVAAAIVPLFFFADSIPYPPFIGDAESLRGTRLGLIIVYTAFNLPLGVWMMRSFFDEVPKGSSKQHRSMVRRYRRNYEKSSCRSCRPASPRRRCSASSLRGTSSSSGSTSRRHPQQPSPSG